jgi:hypothetical protein
MRRWRTVLPPALLAAAWLSILFAPLLVVGQALANRDIAVFHLPLRAIFGELAAYGLPLWNPWVHGGQPIISNPSYGAFYPPSWLVVVVEPATALTLLVLIHGALAFAGAWRLARHFGCSRGVAALAAVAYSGSGPYLSMLSAFTLYCSLAWLPWVLVWGDRTLRPLAGEPWWRPGILAGFAMGLQLLNGEPSTVVMSGLALLSLAAGTLVRRPAVALRLLVPILFASALSAVQILPTLSRLADSPRQGLTAAHAAIWSMRPQRLIEVFIPRFFGDPNRYLEGNYFGWDLEDRNYPYVESLYPGLLLAVLGAASLLRSRIPRRSAWGLALLGGCALSFGRYNPAYPLLRRVPVLSLLRFPEKFAILAVLALVIAGVLGWQRLLEEREAGRPSVADFPLAMTLAVLIVVLALTAFLYLDPRAAVWLLSQHLPPALVPAAQESALPFARAQGWSAAGTAGAVAALFALCRWRRPSRRLLEGLALLLVAADLWYYVHRLLVTIPASHYRRPPPLAAALLPARDRIFVQIVDAERGEKLKRSGDPETLVTRTTMARLDSYSGLLWHIAYAFETDFDFMLTGWGRTADEILVTEAPSRERTYRYLGVWNVGTLVLHEEPQGPEGVKDPLAASLRLSRNPYVLSRFRFVPEATFQPTYAAALSAARGETWRVARHEQLVRPGRPPESVSFRSRPHLLGLSDEGGRIRLDYAAEDGALWIAAMTFDRGWLASVDGHPVPVFPTAACQVGLLLPPGQHRVLLHYHERLLRPGAALTLTALLAGAGALVFAGRRRL